MSASEEASQDRQSGGERRPDSARRRRFFSKRPLVIAVLALLLLCVLIGVFTAKSGKKITSRTVEFGLRNIGELATQAGYFTNVQTISGSRDIFGVTVPFTQSKYVYSYDGVVKAGVDFREITVSLDEPAKTLTVSLPAARILDVNVDEDSLVVYDESKNIFSPLKMNDIKDSITALKEEVRQKAVDNGILRNAESNAETLIKGFLQGAFSQDAYAIRFEWRQKGEASHGDHQKEAR